MDFVDPQIKIQKYLSTLPNLNSLRNLQYSYHWSLNLAQVLIACPNLQSLLLDNWDCISEANIRRIQGTEEAVYPDTLTVLRCLAFDEPYSNPSPSIFAVYPTC